MKKITDIREIRENILYLCEGSADHQKNEKFIVIKQKKNRMMDIAHITECKQRGDPNKESWGPMGQGFFDRYVVYELGVKEEFPEYFL